MVHQLRIYEIFEHNKAAFHERFRDHAIRIMKSYGFEIIAMWETKTDERSEFVYILRWQDEPTMRSAWAGFRVDEEWKEIKRVTRAQHGDLVGEIEERILVPTSYSPLLESEVQRANLAKSEFVAFVAHELKNPMTSIKGYSELLAAGSVGQINEMQANFLNTIRANVQRMSALVSDLNDNAKIEAGQLRLEYKPVQVEDVVDE